MRSNSRALDQWHTFLTEGLAHVLVGRSRSENSLPLPDSEATVRIAEGRKHGRLNLANEGGRASTHRADPAPGLLRTATVADPAGTEAEGVFAARHRTTIGRRTLSRKARNAVRVMQRRNTAPARKRPSPICGMSQAMALGALKQNDNWEKRRSPRLDETSKTDLKQCADKYLVTPFRKRGNPLYLAFLIGRSKSTLNYAIFNFSHMRISFLSALTAGQSSPVDAHIVCILQAGSMRSFAFGTWPSHALHQVHKQGCPSSLALSSRGTEAGKR
ncbi:hypothetical protein [Bradyrhizobium sp.]|uniref:hypothetical protein n=1 Tax=Bradyrhizobium sp. TaxID=376 RepID=UPI003C6F0FE0